MASTSSSKSQRKQTFRKEYSNKWPCIIRSKVDEFTARCTVCECDFSISHGGANDITAHVKRKKHITLAQSRESNQNIGQFFRRSDYSTIRAETLMANFLIEHNLPFAIMDHFSELVPKMFPDSKVASSFACKRTKSTAIARMLGQLSKGKKRKMFEIVKSQS